MRSCLFLDICVMQTDILN